MEKEFSQKPKGGNKFITVGDLLDFAEGLRREEVPRERLVLVDGITGWGNELRGLKIKKG